MWSGASGFLWLGPGRSRREGVGGKRMGPATGRPLLRLKKRYFFFAAFRFFFLVVLFLAPLRLVVRFFALLRLVAFLAFFLFTAIFTSGGSELRPTRFGQAMHGEPVGSPVCPGDG